MKNTFKVSNPRYEIVLFTVHLSWLLCSPCFLKKTENRFLKHLKDVSIFCVFPGFCFQNIYPNGLIAFETCFVVLKTENLFPKQQPNRLKPFECFRELETNFFV
jgi:hypothetical protein